MTSTKAAVEDRLGQLLSRLGEILAEPALTQDALVEVMTIYNDVAHVFLRLSAVGDRAELDRLGPWRAAFHDDPELDATLRDWMAGLRCPDPEVEAARLEFLDQLSRVPDQAGERRVAGRLAGARAVTDQLTADRARLLDRLGVSGAGAPAARFDGLLAGTASVPTRRKLVRAWQATTQARVDELVAAVDAVVDARRRPGGGSVLSRTLERSQVDEVVLARFLDRSLELAVIGRARLAAEVAAVTGEAEHPMDGYGSAVRAALGDAPLVSLDLDECLDFAFAVAQQTFGLTLRRTGAPGTFAGDAGEIIVDPWERPTKQIAANYTDGIHNRTDWGRFVQRPVAYVSCRFRAGPEGQIGFQNAYTLLHEIGHAVNHLLIRGHVPFGAGLEYLPPERRECLSMWFEKWALHPDFARVVAPGSAAAVAASVRLKRVEHRRTQLERAVAAALDLDLHRRPDGGLRAAYERLDERFGIGPLCGLGDVAAYFTWPRYATRPGAAVIHLIGEAHSCATHGPLPGPVPALPRPEAFDPCLDSAAAFVLPDPAAVPAYFDSTTLTGTVSL